MAAKKKHKKGSTSKQTASKKVTTGVPTSKKRAAATGTAKKKSAAKARKALPAKPTSKKKTNRKGKPEQAEFGRDAAANPSGLQSGDLQGLSGVESADSESVDELLEEGNASEAGIVSGVEQAEDEVEKPVRTHEVPEDDVPEEYLDKE